MSSGVNDATNAMRSAAHCRIWRVWEGITHLESGRIGTGERLELHGATEEPEGGHRADGARLRDVLLWDERATIRRSTPATPANESIRRSEASARCGGAEGAAGRTLASSTSTFRKSTLGWRWASCANTGAIILHGPHLEGA